MLIPLDRDAAVPLSRQIATYVEELIRRGHLPGGTRLPATRTLARTLDVNRKTVETAYEELAARRLVAVRPGRAAIVRTSIPERPELDLPFRPSRGRDPFPAGAWATPEPPSAEVVDLAGVTPRLRHFPAAALRRFHEEALAQGGPLFTPPPPLGEAALRRAAAGLLARGGVLRPAEEVAVFASRAEAFAAVVDLFVPAGDLVLLDAPVDPEIGAALRERGVRAELLPAANDALRSALAERADARLLVAMTGPAGLPAPPPDLVRRRALLDAVRERHLPLVEDVTGGEHAPAPRSLRSPRSIRRDACSRSATSPTRSAETSRRRFSRSRRRPSSGFARAWVPRRVDRTGWRNASSPARSNGRAAPACSASCASGDGSWRRRC